MKHWPSSFLPANLVLGITFFVGSLAAIFLMWSDADPWLFSLNEVVNSLLFFSFLNFLLFLMVLIVHNICRVVVIPFRYKR